MEHKINVIKEYRNITGAGLRESVDAVKAYEQGDMTFKNEVEQAIEKVKQGLKSGAILTPKQSTQKAIRRELTSIKNSLDELISDCEDDFDRVDKDGLENIINDAENILRLARGLEDE